MFLVLIFEAIEDPANFFNSFNLVLSFTYYFNLFLTLDNKSEDYLPKFSLLIKFFS